MKYFIHLLSFLLHHSNRLGRDTEFYKIKERILKMYAVESGYDIQVIHGKVCHSCGGNGTRYAFTDDERECSNCSGDGWWKNPFYVRLQRYSFVKFTFHIPGPKQFNATPSEELSAGATDKLHHYIEHAKPKSYAKACKLILFILFDFKTFLIRITPYHWKKAYYYDYHLWKPSHILLKYCAYHFMANPN